MAETPRVDPVEAARERVQATLQVLWEKAGVRSSYVKSEWIELEASIDALRDVAAAEATAWMRGEVTEILEDLPELLRDLAELARTLSLDKEAAEAERRAGRADLLLEKVREFAERTANTGTVDPSGPLPERGPSG
jgi:hypothetical protein